MTQAKAMIEGFGSRSPAREARLTIRGGKHRGHTAGLAPGYVQGNLCILPADYATEFASFCQRNPKPCPLIGMSAPGDPRVPTLAQDLDIRTDVPRYRVFRHGELADEPSDITDLWRDDLVAFVLGCSFSFEEALLDAGIPLHHIERGENVAMYKSNIDTVPAGRFGGKMVVSMRAMRPGDAIRAIQITSRFPNVHGAPVHLGLPHVIGITDLEKPFAGSRPRMQD
ncbi:MAG: putative hydro-lyase, partial [Paracoccaceae bacterium]